MALPGRTTLDNAIVRLLPTVPRPIVRHLSSRYIAGPSIDDAIRVVRGLNQEHKLATVDVLGEEATNADQVRVTAGLYHDVLARIEAENLDAGISIKLTGLGLDLDPELCFEVVEAIVVDAKTRGRFVRIDMEDSSTTDRTLALYRALRRAGHDNVGAVVQAYLRRTLDDVAGLENVRICKGIYAEDELVAYQGYDAVRASYLGALERALAEGAYVGIATHDEYLIEEALGLVAGLPRNRYEFQMLLGVRPDRADELVAAGHRVRVYVPFGTQWYEYSVRRLQENPAIAGYVATDTIGRLLGRR
jgi:proline dehydrogenase